MPGLTLIIFLWLSKYCITMTTTINDAFKACISELKGREKKQPATTTIRSVLLYLRNDLSDEETEEINRLIKEYELTAAVKYSGRKELIVGIGSDVKSFCEQYMWKTVVFIGATNSGKSWASIALVEHVISTTLQEIKEIPAVILSFKTVQSNWNTDKTQLWRVTRPQIESTMGAIQKSVQACRESTTRNSHSTRKMICIEVYIVLKDKRIARFRIVDIPGFEPGKTNDTSSSINTM